MSSSAIDPIERTSPRPNIVSNMNGNSWVFNRPAAHMMIVNTTATPSTTGPRSSNNKKYGRAIVPMAP